MDIAKVDWRADLKVVLMDDQMDVMMAARWAV